MLDRQKVTGGGPVASPRVEARPASSRAPPDERVRTVLGNRAYGAFARKRGVSASSSEETEAPRRETEAVIARMERAFGRSFRGVEVRTDDAAAARAAALGALAYTEGSDIGFARGAFSPDTRDGLRVIAHEFAHVVQGQRGGGATAKAGSIRRYDGSASQDPAELDADAAAEAVLDGRTPDVKESAAGGEVLRKEASEDAADGPAPGKYFSAFDGEGYYYEFRVEDTRKWPDVWTEVIRIHLATVYPTAPGAVREAAMRSITDPQVRTVFARPSSFIFYRIDPALHRRLSSWMQARHPEHRPEPVPDEASSFKRGAGTARRRTEHVAGAAIRFPGVSAERHDKALSVLQQIIRRGAGAQRPGDIVLSPKAIELLVQIADSPQREAIIRSLREAGPAAAGATPQSLEGSFETAIANAEIERARKILDLGEFTKARGDEPIERRPVHGQILNKTGYLVPGIEARFEFEVLDDRDAFRVPIISILWVARPVDRPTQHVAREVTTYVPVRSQSIIDDRIFNFEFKETGEYVIEAFVSHNFFLPNHFTQRVSVVAELALAERLLGEASKGFAKPGQPAATLSVGTERIDVTSGKLAPGARALTIEDRLKAAGDEKKLAEDLVAQYEKVKSDEARAIVKWARAYLETLEKSRKRLEADKGATPVAVRGAFASRTAGVPSRALTLLCYFRREGSGYALVLNDFSHLVEPDDWRFEGRGSTMREAAGAAFLAQAGEYPLGALTVTFQDFDETAQRPKDEYLTLAKTTYTVWKGAKQYIFGTVADVAVNLTGAVMMVIPGLQLAGLIITIAYNSAKTLSDMEHKWTVGKKGPGDYVPDVGMLALNLIPLAGRGAKLVTIAGKTFYAVESVTYLGNVLVMTASAMASVEQARNGAISELAKLDQDIRNLERVNLSDPGLPEMKRRREQLIKSASAATAKAFAEAFAAQAAQMVAQHLIAGYVQQRIDAARFRGRFQHEDGVKARYDWERERIVGDEAMIDPVELTRFERVDAQNRALRDAVPDLGARRQIAEAIGPDAEVRTGAAETRLVREGERTVLEVADGASADAVLAAAREPPAGGPPPVEPPPVAAPEMPPPTAPGPPEEKPAPRVKEGAEERAPEPRPPEEKRAPKQEPPAEEKRPAQEKSPAEEKKPPPEEQLATPEELEQARIADVEPVGKEPPDPAAVEARVEAEVQVAAEREAKARAAYDAAVEKGYARKTPKKDRLGLETWIRKYQEGWYYDQKATRWNKLEKAPRRKPPKPFAKGISVDAILESLAGPKSTSTFKKYYELLRSIGVEESRVREAVEKVRKRYGADERETSVDTIRHEIKRELRDEILDRMFHDAEGRALDAEASHKKMLEMTSKLDSADKGSIAEEWLQRMREATADPATLEAVEASPRQVVVRKEDFPGMRKDRRLDRVEGEEINEVKSGDDYLAPQEKDELTDHLAIVRKPGAAVTAAGTPTAVKRVKWTMLSPQGARRNVRWMIEQLKVAGELSFELYNDRHQVEVFTRDKVIDPLTRAETGAIERFLGIEVTP